MSKKKLKPNSYGEEFVVKNTKIIFFGDIISKIISLVIIILVTRTLGVEEFGKFSFAMGFAALFIMFADLGINSYIRREISRNTLNVNTYVSNSIFVKLLLACATVLLTIISAYLLNYTGYDLYLVVLAIIMLSFETLSETFNSAFVATQKVKYATITKIIRVLFRFIVIIPLLVFGLDAKTVLYVFLGSQVLSIFIQKVLYDKHIKKFSWIIRKKDAVNILKKGIPFGIATIFITIYFKIDITMLSKMAGDEAVGIYSAAYNLLEALYYIPIALTIALLPLTANLFLHNKKRLEVIAKNATRFIFVVSIPVAIGVLLLSEKIVLLIYGDEFINTHLALSILIVTIIPSFYTYILGLLQISANKEKIGIFTTGSAAFFNIVLNIILIPKYSFVGAAVATVITETYLVLINHYFVRKHLFNIGFSSMIRPLIAGSAMTAVILLLVNYHLFIQIFAGAIVYIGTLYMANGFSFNEFKALFTEFRSENTNKEKMSVKDYLYRFLLNRVSPWKKRKICNGYTLLIALPADLKQMTFLITEHYKNLDLTNCKEILFCLDSSEDKVSTLLKSSTFSVPHRIIRPTLFIRFMGKILKSPFKYHALQIINALNETRTEWLLSEGCNYYFHDKKALVNFFHTVSASTSIIFGSEKRIIHGKNTVFVATYNCFINKKIMQACRPSKIFAQSINGIYYDNLLYIQELLKRTNKRSVRILDKAPKRTHIYFLIGSYRSAIKQKSKNDEYLRVFFLTLINELLKGTNGYDKDFLTLKEYFENYKQKLEEEFVKDKDRFFKDVEQIVELFNLDEQKTKKILEKLKKRLEKDDEK